MELTSKTMRICGTCKQQKPLTYEFFFRDNKKGGFTYLCRECSRNYNKHMNSDDLGKRIAQILHETALPSVSSRGYNPETVERILALLDQQKQELLDALTIEKDSGVIFVPEPEHPRAYEAGYKRAYDRLEARKAKLSPPEAEAKDE